ncbi:MAG: DMT family transporter [Planctomycetota bacterium]
MDRERRIGLMLAVTTALLWGTLAIAMKYATDRVARVDIAWFRFTFAAVLLGIGIAIKDRKRLVILRRPPKLGLVAAMGLTGNYLGYLAGLHRTTPSNAQILIQTAPLMLALVGIFLFKERLNRQQWIGVAIASVGFLVFAWDQSNGNIVPSAQYMRGNGFIFIGAVTWVVYAAITKWMTGHGWQPQDLNLLIYTLPALTLWPMVDFSALSELSPRMWVLMCFLGANTLVAYGCLGEAFKRLPAYQVSLIISMNPLITLASMAILGLWSFDWLPKDRVGPMGYGAAALVVSGIVTVLSRATRKAPAPAAHTPAALSRW